LTLHGNPHRGAAHWTRLDGIEQWQIETIAPRGRIRSLRWSPDGTKIATVSSDGHIRIFDWRGNQLSLVQLIAHRDYRFESVDFHRHAAQLFATTASRLVRADITDGKIVAEANIADVSSMQWVDGIDRIAVASPAGVELRNPTNLQRTAMLPGRYKHVCWSGDGKRCAYLSKGSVWVHPLRNGTFAAKPLGRRRLRATPQGLTLSPSKSHLAIVFADRVEVMNRDSATPAISVASPQRLESVAFGDTDAKLVFGTYAGVAQLRATRLGGPEFRHQAWGRSQVAWNPRGDLIAVGQRGLLRIVDPQLKTIHKIGAVKSVRSAQQIGSGQTVILFRSGKIVCTDAGGKIIGWSTFLPDGRRVAERLLTSARPNRVSVGISDGGFQPMDIGIPIAGLDAAAATDRQTPLVRRLHDGSRFVVEIWDQHAQRWQTFWKSKERISCAEVSPDGRRVAVLSGSQTLNLIDPSSGQLLLQRKLAELRFQNQYFWIDNRSLLVAGAANMTARNLARYEIDGDRWVWTVQEPHDATAAEVIRLDEATFLQAGSVHFVRSLSDGQPLETIDVESHYGRRHGRLYRDADSPHYFSWGYPFGLSYDANSSDGIVCWDAQTFKPQWLLTDLGEAETVSLSPAGQIISATPGAIEQLIWIVDTDTGRALLNREEFQLQL